MVSASRKPGEPGAARRPAGAPEEAPRPAGAPASAADDAPAPPDARGPQEPRHRSSAPERAGRDAEGAEAEPRTAAQESEKVERDFDALLAETKRERDEYLALAQRARADFENYRKRAAREASEAERRGRSTLVRQLVPVVDNLERALRAAGVDPDGETATDEDESNGGGLAHGVRLVFRELRGVLEVAGVEAYDPTGEQFDPTWHEALSTRPVDGADPGTVVETVEKGYRLDGQVLRPARVIVGE